MLMRTKDMMPRIMRKAILDSDVNEDEGHDAQDNEKGYTEH